MKKGFTLIELLVIITIMGLLATLLIPNVVKIIERTENKTFLEDGKAIIRASENYINQDPELLQEGECFDLIGSDIDITLSENIVSGKVCYINSKPYLMHISNGNKCLSGEDNNLETYECGEKAVIFFDGSILGKNNNPYINIPFFAILTDKDRVLDLSNYRDIYTQYDGNDTTYAYNFWQNYNLQHVGTKWIDQNGTEVTDLSVSVSSDKVYKISEIFKVHDSKPTYYGLRSGDYEISIASDDTKKLGYLNLDEYDNLPQISKYGLWTIKNYGDYYQLFSYDTPNIILDSYTGAQEEGALLDVYPNENMPYQKFNLLKTSEEDVYQIQGNDNEELCVQAETLDFGSNFYFRNCDSSNPNQLFRIKKYK